MHTGLACVRLSGCQRVVEPPPCPSYIPSDRCLQSFETYRRLNATPRSPLHGCTQPDRPSSLRPYPSHSCTQRSPQRAAKYKSGQAVFKTSTIHRFHRRPSPAILLQVDIYIYVCMCVRRPSPLSSPSYIRPYIGDSISMMFACNSIVDRQRAWPRQWTTLDRPSSINHLDDPGAWGRDYISRFDKRAITPLLPFANHPSSKHVAAVSRSGGVEQFSSREIFSLPSYRWMGDSPPMASGKGVGGR